MENFVWLPCCQQSHQSSLIESAEWFMRTPHCIYKKSRKTALGWKRPCCYLYVVIPLTSKNMVSDVPKCWLRWKHAFKIDAYTKILFSYKITVYLMLTLCLLAMKVRCFKWKYEGIWHVEYMICFVDDLCLWCAFCFHTISSCLADFRQCSRCFLHKKQNQTNKQGCDV